MAVPAAEVTLAVDDAFGQADGQRRVVELPETAPIQTLALVDLYLDQGLVTEAGEMLEAMLLVNPNDVGIRQKLAEIQGGSLAVLTPEGALLGWLAGIESVKRQRGLALLVG